jgi:DNA sulfur modification protein DndD
MMVKFAFIATIVGMAAKNTKISSVNWISEPVVAPLVLDAPFSVLDPEYRANTAINLSSHVQQLILMTNSDAWNGDLRSRLVNKIGKRYLIVSYAKGSALSTEKNISIDGETHRLNYYESDRDESRIVEV